MAKDAHIRQLEQQLAAETEARQAAEGQVEQLQAQLAIVEEQTRHGAEVDQQLQEQMVQEQKLHQAAMVSRGIAGCGHTCGSTDDSNADHQMCGVSLLWGEPSTVS